MSKDLAQKQNELELQNAEWDLHEVEESKPLEFTAGADPKLYGLQINEAKQLLGGIDVISEELQVLKDAYVDVIKLEITPDNLPIFKDLRKNFTKNRTSREKLRVAKKSYFLNGGRFVDAVFKNIDAECDLMETKLFEAEKFFENQEKERLALIKKEREELFRPFVETLPNDLETLDQDVFDSFLETKKKAHSEKIEAERLEALRIEEQRLAEIERQKAIEAENAKLKAQAEAKEKELQKERAEAEAKQKAIQEEADRKAREEKAKQDAILKAEQEAKAKLESELQAKKDAEIKAENERIAKEIAEKTEAEKLAKAPIKKQLSVWVNSFEIPVVGVDNETSKEIKEKFESFKKWSLTQVNNL